MLALDLGGTRIRAAVVLGDGTLASRTEGPTPIEAGPPAIVRACRDAVLDARADANADVRHGIVGVGISSPGPVDPATGRIVEPPNLGPSFRDVPMADELAEATGLPAFLDRDTNVAALGEAAFGAARECTDFIYLTVSTGIGGAIVTGGRLLHGPDGFAGELGHVPVALDGPRCGCGGVAHVEAIAAGVSLARDARALAADGASPYLVERAREMGIDELSAKDVADGALAGDASCVALMERARRAIAAACVGYVNAFNPRRIVIGGAIAVAEGERLLGPIRAAIATETFKVLSRRVTVLPAALGGDVSLAGAHPLVMSRLAASSGRLPTQPSQRPGHPIAAPAGGPSR